MQGTREVLQKKQYLYLQIILLFAKGQKNDLKRNLFWTLIALGQIQSRLPNQKQASNTLQCQAYIKIVIEADSKITVAV